jgi:hypothetical protein
LDDDDPLAGEATPFLQSRGNSRNRSLLTIFVADQPRSRLVGIEDGALMQIMPQVNAKMVRLDLSTHVVRAEMKPVQERADRFDRVFRLHDRCREIQRAVFHAMPSPHLGLHERLASDQHTHCCPDAGGQPATEGEARRQPTVLLPARAGSFRVSENVIERGPP